MYNIKIITIIVTLIIISVVAVTPPKVENFIIDAVAGAFNSAFGSGGSILDVEGIAKKIAGEVFNNLINPALQPVRAMIDIIPKNAGVPDLVGIVDNLLKMEPYIKNVLMSFINMNLILNKVFIQLNIDTKNIKSVTPVIKKCIQRIEYSHQRFLNILKCVKLLGFMVENRRPIFIIRAIKLLMYNIIDTTNYIKMSIRTTFIDLHNTNPPLWEVINGPAYKSSIISVLNSSKIISKNMNALIQINSKILGNLRSFLNRPIVSVFDYRNLRGTITIFENMLRHMKIVVINIPDIRINMDYSIIYKIAKNIVITGTIPPGKSLTYNRDYIQENIKNHPY